jgi:glycosyltransferase involved in cell wall biosynthesis
MPLISGVMENPHLKIAIIGSRGYPYVYSGYETFVSELAIRLVQKGHDVFVYCHKGLFQEHPPAVNRIHLLYLPAIEKKILSQFSHSFLSTVHVLFKKIDVVFYVNPANGLFGIFTRVFGKKTAINVDGLEWLRPKWKGLGAKYFRFASCLATRLFDAVVTDSERMAEIYEKEFNSPSVTIAYGATIAYSKQPELIKEFGLEHGDYYLVVGRLIPDNNGDLIVRAFEKSVTKRKLILLGDVPYEDYYAESVRKTKDRRIIFPGYVKEQEVLRELYCNSYAYIHGHEFGGTNPALLQALGYGCCVLALDTPFNREVLADEKHGIYFRKTEDSMLRVLDYVEHNQSFVQRKREIARSRIKENYTWEKITDQYIELFDKLASSRFRPID